MNSALRDLRALASLVTSRRLVGLCLLQLVAATAALAGVGLRERAARRPSPPMVRRWWFRRRRRASIEPAGTVPANRSPIFRRRRRAVPPARPAAPRRPAEAWSERCRSRIRRRAIRSRPKPPALPAGRRSAAARVRRRPAADAADGGHERHRRRRCGRRSIARAGCSTAIDFRALNNERKKAYDDAKLLIAAGRGRPRNRAIWSSPRGSRTRPRRWRKSWLDGRCLCDVLIQIGHLKEHCGQMSTSCA